MSARRTLMQIATNAAIGFGALFLVGVLLAAIPNHRTPEVASVTEMAGAQEQQAPPEQDHGSMPGMNMDESKSNEMGAMHDMAHMGHGDSAHMHMTAPRPQGPGDLQKANEIVKELR